VQSLFKIAFAGQVSSQMNNVVDSLGSPLSARHDAQPARSTNKSREREKLSGVCVREAIRKQGHAHARTHTYLEDVRRVVGGVAVVIMQPHPVLPQLLPDKLGHR